MMDKKVTTHVSFSIFVLLLALVISTTCVEDHKNHFTSDPHSGNSPTKFQDSLCTHRTPPSSHSSPPHHGSSPPSHGGGYSTPAPPTPSNCGSTPPHDPPTSHNPTPSNPPSSGGYYNSPPPSGGGSPLVDPPITYTPPPSPPTPYDPGTPSVPPFLPSPSPFTGTCNYWKHHPGMIWGILGFWGTIGNTFGVNTPPGISSGMTLPQALSNTRTDGIGALYREGTASFLNSLVNKNFPYTTPQVKDMFASSLHSNKAATLQAKLFKMANEGKMTPRP